MGRAVLNGREANVSVPMALQYKVFTGIFLSFYVFSTAIGNHGLVLPTPPHAWFMPARARAFACNVCCPMH